MVGSMSTPKGAQATAAKSAAAPPASSVVPAPQGSSPEAEPTVEPTFAKKARTYSEEEKSIHNAHTLIKRIADGRVAKATGEQVGECKEALQIYEGLSREDRGEFAKKVELSKKDKNFKWVRTFKESLKFKKQISQGTKENYYTRTCMHVWQPQLQMGGDPGKLRAGPWHQICFLVYFLGLRQAASGCPNEC